jgi:TatD DNase family protein
VFVDTHCHLDFNSFDEDRDQVIERARENEVDRILNPGTDMASSQAGVNLSAQYAEVYAAIGIHPNEALTWDDRSISKIVDLASAPKVVAIGEIGLDYYRDKAPKQTQERVFREQLALAGELGLPVIIHNRDASEDVFPILEDWHRDLVNTSSPLADRPGVLHSFSANADHARTAISLNFLIGITGPVTFKNASGLQILVREVQLDFLLIETDAPFLAPHPKRGLRNEPAYVRFVAEKIAELQNRSCEDIAVGTASNAQRLFQW